MSNTRKEVGKKKKNETLVLFNFIPEHKLKLTENPAKNDNHLFIQLSFKNVKILRDLMVAND